MLLAPRWKMPFEEMLNPLEEMDTAPLLLPMATALPAPVPTLAVPLIACDVEKRVRLLPAAAVPEVQNVVVAQASKLGHNQAVAEVEARKAMLRSGMGRGSLSVNTDSPWQERSARRSKRG